MPMPLVAKHVRPDGQRAAKVELPRFFTRDEAAASLALVYSEQSAVTGERGVRDGLSRAARERVLTQRGAEKKLNTLAPLVETYKQVMDKHWNRFFRYDEQDRWVGAGDPRSVKARFDAPVFFTFEEAAAALAIVHSDVLVTREVRDDDTVMLTTSRRVGRMTLTQGLHKAAHQRVLARRKLGDSQQEQDRVEFWRRQLLSQGPWSEDPTGRDDPGEE